MSGKPTGTFCSNIWEDRPAELWCLGGRIPALPVSPGFEEFYGEQTPSALLTHPTPHHIYLPQQNSKERYQKKRLSRHLRSSHLVTLHVYRIRCYKTIFIITDTLSFFSSVFFNLLPKIDQTDKVESLDVSATGSWVMTLKYTISMILQSYWLNLW